MKDPDGMPVFEEFNAIQKWSDYSLKIDKIPRKHQESSISVVHIIIF